MLHRRDPKSQMHSFWCPNQALSSKHYFTDSIGEANFAGCNIDGYLSEDIIELLQQHKNLRKFILSKNNIDELSIVDLASVLEKNASLNFVDLSHNQIGSNGAKRVFDAIQRNEQTKLTILNLSNNKIDSINYRTIEQFFEINKSLQELILDDNALNTPDEQDETLTTLFKSLAYHQSLVFLSLKNVKLRNQHISNLIDGVQRNSSLNKINLEGSLTQINKNLIIDLIKSLSSQNRTITLMLGEISADLARSIEQANQTPCSTQIIFNITNKKLSSNNDSSAHAVSTFGMTYHKQDQEYDNEYLDPVAGSARARFF